jgi:hypothetical protein
MVAGAIVKCTLRGGWIVAHWLRVIAGPIVNGDSAYRLLL